jgi:hypothetical protein
MTNVQRTAFGSPLAALLIFGAMPAATFAADLSRYRNFELGSDLATVAKQAAADPSQAKVIHSRPALIQELNWRPQPLGASSQTDPCKKFFSASTTANYFGSELTTIGTKPRD